MVILVILIAFIIVVSIIAILYVVSKQKEEFMSVLNEDIIGEKLGKETKLYTVDIMSEERFNKLLNESIDKPKDLEILKQDIQNRLRMFTKLSDISKARLCNEQLKKIDIAIKQKGVNN